MLKAQLPVGGLLGNDLMGSSLTESMGRFIDYWDVAETFRNWVYLEEESP